MFDLGGDTEYGCTTYSFLEAALNYPFRRFSASIALLVLSACSNPGSGTTVPANVSAYDRAFVTGATQASNAEIADAKIALAKSANTAIIAFANEMVTQHTAQEQALAPIADSLQFSPPPVTSLNPTQAAQNAMLQATPEPAFDAAYINRTVAGHQLNITTNFQPEIAYGTNPQLVSYAKTYLPQVQMHLQMAQSIKTQYGF